MYAIETENLTKYYGRHRGIIQVNIRVNEGEIFGFIGPNGAGKSTFIRTILNFIYPTEGSGIIFGKDIVKESKSIKKMIGYVPSEVRYYGKVKVKDLLDYANSFKEASDGQVGNLMKELDIDENKFMYELSLGNKKKVSIAQALLGNPKLLILDEPASGLDPLMQKKLFHLLKEFKDAGNTVFLSSHNLVEVGNLCDRVAIIKDGRIVDVIDLKSTIKDFGRIIDIEGNVPKSFIEELADKIILEEENRYRFIYKGEMDGLIKSLSKYQIKDLSVRKENLEDTFMKYYEEEEG